MALTAIKDTDFKILLELSDSDLDKVCSLNRYFNRLCNDDDFWRLKVYSLTEPGQEIYLSIGKKFHENSSWKQIYQDLKNERYSLYDLVLDDDDINYYYEQVDKLNLPPWINRELFLKDLKEKLLHIGMDLKAAINIMFEQITKKILH